MAIINNQLVKTRKKHTCWGCGRHFPAGVNLQRITSTGDGRIVTIYFCDVCQEYWTLYMQDGEEVNLGDLRDKDWEELKIKMESMDKPADAGGREEL